MTVRRKLSLMYKRTSTSVKLMVLTVLILLLGISLQKLPGRTGKTDFRAYWSASYLLAHGENFADEGTLLTVQRQLTRFDKDYAMNTWNPPWVLVWLLPFTWLGFDKAVSLWLLTNIGALCFSVVMSWQMLFPTDDDRNKWLWLPLLAAVLFPSTIVSLMFGQVNLLVLAGLVGFLAFYAKGQDVAAGSALALTTFKPHLVYLVLPILFLHAWKQRRWGVLAGFLGLLTVSTSIVLMFRPTFLIDYFQGATAGNLLAWESATAVSYLSFETGWPWIRLVAVGLLPLTLLAWFYLGGKWNLMAVAQVGVLASLITMPFGWSYDFVLLLLPIAQVLVWLVTENLPVGERLALVGMLLVTYLVYFFQRIATPSELYFYWVPLVTAAAYGWVAWRCTGYVDLYAENRGALEHIDARHDTLPEKSLARS